MKLNTALKYSLVVLLVISILGNLCLIGYYIPIIVNRFIEKKNINETYKKWIKRLAVLLCILGVYTILCLIGYYIPRLYNRFKNRYVSTSELVDSDKRVDDTYEYVIR